MNFWIAQASSNSAGTVHLIEAMAVLMLVVLVGFGGILFFRHRLRKEEANDKAAGPNTGFSLSSLRSMVDRGELTREEYERARPRVIQKVKAHTAEPRPQKKESGGPNSGAHGGGLLGQKRLAGNLHRGAGGAKPAPFTPPNFPKYRSGKG